MLLVALTAFYSLLEGIDSSVVESLFVVNCVWVGFGPFFDVDRSVPSNPTIIVLRKRYEPLHEISNNVVYATSNGSVQPAHTRSLIRAYARRLNILGLFSYWPNIIWSF